MTARPDGRSIAWLVACAGLVLAVAACRIMILLGW